VIGQSVMTTPSVLMWGITATLIEIAAFGISIQTSAITSKLSANGSYLASRQD
jgi:hypothetical protein